MPSPIPWLAKYLFNKQAGIEPGAPSQSPTSDGSITPWMLLTGAYPASLGAQAGLKQAAEMPNGSELGSKLGFDLASPQSLASKTLIERQSSEMPTSPWYFTNGPLPEGSKPEDQNYSNYMASGGSGGEFRDPEMKALFAQLAARSQAAMDAQKKGIGDLENQAKAYADMPTQTDLSPLMALADTWYGGNLQKGYKSPTNPEERIQQLYALQQGIQKARGGLSESEIAALKDQIQGRIKLKELEAMQAERDLKRTQASAIGDEVKARREERDMTENRKAFGENTKGTSAKLEALTTFKHAAEEYAALLEKHGGSAPSQTDPDYLRMQSLYQAMTVPWKETANLGALSGGDVQIIKSALGPSTFTEWLASNAIRPGAALSNIQQVIKANDRVYERNLNQSAKIYPKRHIQDLVEMKRQDYYGGNMPTDTALPTKPDGSPDFAKYTPEQLQMANDYLVQGH